jgi:hypothetical protein
VFAFLISHYLLGGSLFLVIAGVIAAAVFAWPLLLNRYVQEAIIAALLVIGALMWWEHYKDALRAEGAKECVAANVQGEVKRAESIAQFDFDLDDARKEALERAMWAYQSIDRSIKERPSHVSKTADAACVVPRGFVRDHDADVPRSARRAEVPPPQADADVPSGLVLSRVESVVRHNYGECEKVLSERDADNEARYKECVAWDKRFGTESGCVAK